MGNLWNVWKFIADSMHACYFNLMGKVGKVWKFIALSAS